ncbi:MAG: type II secretion system inner membrane protein GspF [Deltaproteobacteria bacterium]|nr:type II secretion system inner membrane protein GspF [Deltaproteobacteria bacterium]
MPVYTYRGANSAGKSLRGFVDAENLRAARARLRRDGVFVTDLTESAGSSVKAERGAGGAFSLGSLRRVSQMDVALATRQLATLVGAGIPLVEALTALGQQCENPRLKSVVGQVRDRVNQGSALADAMANTGPFSDLYVGMVRAGETGGALETVLARLAEYLESQVRLRNKVGSILIYPAVMFGFALIVVAALVVFVLPQIAELLKSLNQPLPIYTRIIISGSHFAQQWWWALLAGAVAFGFGFRALVRTPAGRAWFDRTRLRLPVVGRVSRTLAISRFTRTLSTLLAGGIPIVRALETAKHVANNVVIGEAVDAAKEAITGGASLAKPLRASGQFPPLVTHMVEVGEASGELEAMLGKVADTYDEQVETTMTRLTALLEPLLILLMVGIVMVIISATLVPLLQITSSLR